MVEDYRVTTSQMFCFVFLLLLLIKSQETGSLHDAFWVLEKVQFGRLLLGTRFIPRPGSVRMVTPGPGPQGGAQKQIFQSTAADEGVGKASGRKGRW